MKIKTTKFGHKYVRHTDVWVIKKIRIGKRVEIENLVKIYSMTSASTDNL